MLKIPSVTELSFAEITSKKKSAGLLCCSHICPRNINTVYRIYTRIIKNLKNEVGIDHCYKK